MRIQWIALAIVLSTPVVGAQATSYDGYSYSPIPGSSGGGARTTVTGDFDGDRLPDIAVLRGTEAWLIFGPDVYGAATRYKPEKGSPPIASAIATLAGSPRDELLIAHKFGLSAWTRTRASSFSERAIAGADWANARALAVSPIDNTVYGLDASGTRLGVWTQATGSSWSSLPFIGTKLTIVDWESDGDDELEEESPLSEAHGRSSLTPARSVHHFIGRHCADTV